MTGTFQGAAQITSFFARCWLFRQTDNEITRWQFGQFQTKTLANTALDPISVDSTAQQSLRNHHAKAGVADPIGPSHDNQTIGACPLIFSKNPVKLGLLDQPRITGAHLN